MDKNTIIGLVLITILLFTWARLNSPSQEELDRQKRVKDSIELASKQEIATPDSTSRQPSTAKVVPSDTANVQQLSGEYGAFASAATGTEATEVLENDLFKVTFSNKGGRIKEVELKKYYKITEDSNFHEIKTVLKLLEDPKNRFEYFLPVQGSSKGMVSTQDLFFTASKQGNSITFRATANNGAYFEQKYSIGTGNYNIDYNLSYNGLANVIKPGSQSMILNWYDYLDKIEKNHKYERMYTTVYFKKAKDSPDYCNCSKDDKQESKNEPIKWVSNVNQFFNSSLIAETPFEEGKFETVVFDEKNEDLKLLKSEIRVPLDASGTGSFPMKMYVGPNEFNRLREYKLDLEDVIPYGRSILGTINRWVFRPIFNFLSTFIGSKGLIILLLTLFVKVCLYPISYKMLYSQSKMSALKPKVEELKSKYPDDQQKQSMESMKLYQEFGVNPLGGCLPMLLQMPIWLSLYRFFPAAIEFRQASFLWATDLSSYEVFARLPYDIPGYGSHFSLFAFLWAISSLAYTYFTMKDVDMSANPAMKWMQYIMPLTFLFLFNSVAAGLSYYMLVSNLLNIGQTVITRSYIIDHDKIKHELEEYRKKPKKEGGFRSRLENAMKEQQKQQQAKPKKK